MGNSIGKIEWTFKNGYMLTLKNSENKTIEYKLKKVSVGNWDVSQKQYILQENENKVEVILSINIKHKFTLSLRSYENIEIIFNDNSQINYLMSVCALFFNEETNVIRKFFNISSIVNNQISVVVNIVKILF